MSNVTAINNSHSVYLSSISSNNNLNELNVTNNDYAVYLISYSSNKFTNINASNSNDR